MADGGSRDVLRACVLRAAAPAVPPGQLARPSRSAACKAWGFAGLCTGPAHLGAVNELTAGDKVTSLVGARCIPQAASERGISQDGVGRRREGPEGNGTGAGARRAHRHRGGGQVVREGEGRALSIKRGPTAPRVHSTRRSGGNDIDMRIALAGKCEGLARFCAGAGQRCGGG